LKTIVGLPAVRTVHTVTGFERAPATKHTNGFLFHEHARRLTHVGTFQRPLFDALEGPLAWPSVGLSFAPTAADFARLPNLRRLTLHQPWNEPAQAAAFAGLGALEALVWLGPASPEVLGHLPKLRKLDLRSRLEPAPLQQALAPLTALESLTLGWTPAAGALALPSLQELELRVSAEPRVGAVLESLPSVKKVCLQLNAVREKDVLALFTDRAALSRLEHLSLGILHFARPFRPDGELCIRQWNLSYELPRLVPLLAALPDDCVRRVVMRPLNEDPAVHTTPPPTEEQLAQLRGACSAGLPLRTLPVDVEWW
jgi:hypothetical protein